MVGTKGENFGMLLADSSGNPNGLANAKYYATNAEALRQIKPSMR
jgi:hypothetical protein